MSQIDLAEEERRTLHKYMIDFVIQKRNILDCYDLKTWEIFRKIVTQFPLTPQQLQIEFHCQLLPNLEDYDVNEYYVDYFNKIRYMSSEDKKLYLEANHAAPSLKPMTEPGQESSGGLTRRQPQYLGRSERSLSPYSVERSSEIRGYDINFMRDAQIYFSNMPSSFNPSNPTEKILGIFKPCWEIKTLLKFYPQQMVSKFLWWRMRKNYFKSQTPNTRKRQLPESKDIPAKRARGAE